MRNAFYILFVLALIGWGIYASLDEESIESNNEALTSVDSGDNATAISLLQEAVRDAVTDETKIHTLKNLAYVYEAEGRVEEARTAYVEALTYAKDDSLNQYLLTAELAILDGDPDSAKLNYDKAYKINPNDFQVNNSLALFYIDLNDQWPQYVDYKSALTHATRANESDSKSEITKHNLAIAHYYNENYSETVNLLSTTNFEQHPYMSVWMGFSYLGLGDLDKAREYFQIAVDSGMEVPQEVHDFLSVD